MGRALSTSKTRWLGRRKFPLPPELVLEISLYFSHYPWECYGSCPRLDTLKALSRTCRMFRNVCLPLLWEIVNFGDCGCRRWCPTTLERVITGLIKNPTLSSYVRFVDVYIMWNVDVPVSKLVTCLSLLPNMHTLRLEICDVGQWDPFSDAMFPQVRTLVIVAPDAKLLVPCCPQVRAVIARDRDRGLFNDDLLDLFDESGHILEKLEGFIPSPASVQYLVEIAPNLKHLKFPGWFYPEHLLLLKPLTKLHTIEMHISEPQIRLTSDALLDQWMAVAQEVLRGNEGRRGLCHGGKRVRLIYRCFDVWKQDENGKSQFYQRIEDVEVA